jgi:hypothetical protein
MGSGVRGVEVTRAVLICACAWLAIGFAHVIWMSRSERRHLAAMKRQGYGDNFYSGVGLYTWFLIALIWPVLSYAAICHFIARRKK